MFALIEKIDHKDVIAIAILSPFSALVTTLTNASQLALQYNAALLILVVLYLLRKVEHPFLALFSALSFLSISLVFLFITLTGDHRFNYAFSLTILYVAVLLLYSKENKAPERDSDAKSILVSTLSALLLLTLALTLATKIGVTAKDQISSDISVAVKEGPSGVKYTIRIENAKGKPFTINYSNGEIAGKIKDNSYTQIITLNCSSPLLIDLDGKTLVRKSLCPVTERI